MSDIQLNQLRDEAGKPLGRDPHEVLADIKAGGDKLMAAVKELIEWTDYDVSQAVGYLKQIANFLHAVIEAHPKRYTMAELTEKLGVDEPTLRQLLAGVGTEIDPTVTDPEETLTEPQLIPLLADRAGSKEGEALMKLLRGDGPYIANC
jgi:hypothetical protein